MTDIVHKPVTTLSYFWRLDRPDGAGLAMTSHDRPLDIGGVTYRPAPGLMPSAVERTAGIDTDAAETSGALSVQALTKEDFLAARWDGAASTLFAADWIEPNAPALSLQCGELGQVSMSGDEFHADLQSVANRLDAPICPATSPECRAELGDRDCRVDLAGRSRRATVTECEDQRVRLDIEAQEAWIGGTLRWWSGLNAGARSTILAIEEGSIVLREQPMLAVAVGDQAVCHEGCDKTFGICCTRFDNAVNFRGEPHLPGNDLLTRYPGG